MRHYGFQVVAMWESSLPAGPRFVRVPDWPDMETKEREWNRFLADEEWKEIKRITSAEHGDLVGEVQDHLLVPTPYSPATIVRGAHS